MKGLPWLRAACGYGGVVEVVKCGQVGILRSLARRPTIFD